MILTQSELAALTRRDRPTAQARVLRLLGVPFAVHPVDRKLIVSRAVAEMVLGAPVGAAAPAQPSQGYEVNVEGIRQHGKTTTAH